MRAEESQNFRLLGHDPSAFSDVLQPREVGFYVPARADGRREIQSNDITTDEHGRLYVIDRWDGGMHIVEYTG